MSINSRLFPISYFNPNQSIRLNAYADILVMPYTQARSWRWRSARTSTISAPAVTA